MRVLSSSGQNRLQAAESTVLGLVLAIYPACLSVAGLSIWINGEENGTGTDVERAVLGLVSQGQLVCDGAAVLPTHPPRVDGLGRKLMIWPDPPRSLADS